MKPVKLPSPIISNRQNVAFLYTLRCTFIMSTTRVNINVSIGQSVYKLCDILTISDDCYLKIDIRTAWPSETRTFNTKHRLTILVFNFKVWIPACPFFVHCSNHLTRWCGYLDGLHAAWETAASTGQRTIEMNNLIVIQIQHFHIEWPAIAAEVSSAAIRVFDSHINLEWEGHDIIFLNRVRWECVRWTYSVHACATSLTFWPRQFLMMYLLFASKPIIASVRLVFCLTNNWSSVHRYSRPRGQSGTPTGTVIQSSVQNKNSQKITKLKLISTLSKWTT